MEEEHCENVRHVQRSRCVAGTGDNKRFNKRDADIIRFLLQFD